MAFDITKETTKDLNVKLKNVAASNNSTPVVVDVETDATPIMDLKEYDVFLPYVDPDNPSRMMFGKTIRLDDRTVHNINVSTIDFIPTDVYNDIPSASAIALHLVFPQKYTARKAGVLPPRREFVVKLSIPDNCKVYFHEWCANGVDVTTVHSPKIEYEADEALIGGEMIHYFLETKQLQNYNIFYMKSRTSAPATYAKTTEGYWKVYGYGIAGASKTQIIRDFIDTDVARIWYSGSIDDDGSPTAANTPYLMFDKQHNMWIYMNTNGKVDHVYANAGARSMYLINNRAMAEWND